MNWKGKRNHQPLWITSVGVIFGLCMTFATFGLVAHRITQHVLLPGWLGWLTR